jgi:RNA polymerase sigma-70 factor (ECF subfamily)
MERDEHIFLEAYDAFADPLYRHCFFRVFSAERAQELVQEIFIRTWQYMRKGGQIENMKAFLYRVANNLIIDETRKKKTISLEYLLENDPALEPVSDGERRMEVAVLISEVTQAMNRLPLEYQELLILRYLDGFEPREIAALWNVSPNSVSVKLNRAIKALRSLLKPDQPP